MAETMDSHRLAAARRLSKLLRDPEFRNSVTSSSNDDGHLVIASTEDPMSYVFDQVNETGLPLTLVVFLGTTSLLFFTVDETREDDDCGEPFDLSPEANVGMLLACFTERQSIHINFLVDGAPTELELALA